MSLVTANVEKQGLNSFPSALEIFMSELIIVRKEILNDLTKNDTY